MVICNACRYCEGFCAVFPAMELRRILSTGDLKYLANLCHNCRSCYYACQYAPPHEFNLNVPKTLSALALETYREFAWPSFIGGLLQRGTLSILVITSICAALVLLMTLFYQGPAVLLGTHVGEGSFYKVIPYPYIVLPFAFLGMFVLISFGRGIYNFWQATDGRIRELFSLSANARSLWDVLSLKFLDGGTYGCNYPGEEFSMIRRWFHHFTFYGFLACLMSTVIAAFYDHFLQWPAPYPWLSWPVVLGTCGGLSLLLGTGGLMYLKLRMDRVPASPLATSAGTTFLSLLFLTSLSGLLLLVLRETPAMGSLLAVHIGVVLVLFITLPYGKFLHAIYRYAALVRNANEQIREERHGKAYD